MGWSPFASIILSTVSLKSRNQLTFPNKPWFLRVCYASLMKTLWEKEKFARNGLANQKLCYIQSYKSWYRVNSIHNYKILDRSKSKAFPEDKIVVVQMAKFLIDGVKNIVGKGENARYQHFLLSPQCFHKYSSQGR